MYTTLLASSYWFHPATSTETGISRTYKATFFFALGAVLGWPFSAALGIPFVAEQLFLTGGEVVLDSAKGPWRSKRIETLVKAVGVAALIAVSID